jgi:general secretion pathway protein G
VRLLLKKLRSRAKSVESGYTLLELLVVLGIIALLVGFVAPNVLSYLGRAKVNAANVQMKNVAAALDLYRLDVGAYPSEAEGLDALIAGNSIPGWRGPYLPRLEGLLDPWGEKFIYRTPGTDRDFDLMSLGADKAQGGDGDDADITAK